MLLLVFVLLFVFLLINIKMDKEKVYFISIIIFVTGCYLLNEFLSIFNILDYKHLQGIYIMLSICLIICLIHKIKIVSLFFENLKRHLMGMQNKGIRLLFLMVFCLMLVLALLTIPYNWDSMTYHLPRIAHWTQNKSIAHYVTNDMRQLASPPLSEFINLQVYILTGQSNRFLNLLQYGCFVTNSLILFFITKRLGGNEKYCWLSMLLFVSMPIAFGEALTTQVDHFSTMWLLIFVYFLLDLLEPKHQLNRSKDNILSVLILSSCIGLGYLAKPSIMFAMVIFACWLLIVCIKRKDNAQDISILILLSLGTIVVIISPEVLRNIFCFGGVTHFDTGPKQLVGTLNPIYVFVNGIKNYAMNLPNKYIDIGEIVEYGVYWIAYILNVEIDHPSISEYGRVFYLHKAGEYGHDTAINPIITIFTTIVIVWLVIRRIKREKIQFVESYSWAAAISFIVFLFLLRWEAFVTRYMLSYLALLCPMVAMWLFKMKKREVSNAVVGILVFLSVLELFGLFGHHGKICWNQNIDVNKENGYFVWNEGDKEDYVKLQRILQENEFQNVGLYISAASCYEFPIWTKLDKEVRVEHILVKNESKQYEDKEFIPEIIIVLRENEEDIINYKGRKYYCYEKIEDDKSVWILQKGIEK